MSSNTLIDLLYIKLNSPTCFLLRLLNGLFVMFHRVVPVHTHLTHQRTLSKVIYKKNKYYKTVTLLHAISSSNMFHIKEFPLGHSLLL